MANPRAAAKAASMQTASTRPAPVFVVSSAKTPTALTPQLPVSVTPMSALSKTLSPASAFSLSPPAQKNMPDLVISAGSGSSLTRPPDTTAVSVFATPAPASIFVPTQPDQKLDPVVAATLAKQAYEASITTPTKTSSQVETFTSPFAPLAPQALAPSFLPMPSMSKILTAAAPSALPSMTPTKRPAPRVPSGVYKERVKAAEIAAAAARNAAPTTSFVTVVNTPSGGSAPAPDNGGGGAAQNTYGGGGGGGHDEDEDGPESQPLPDVTVKAPFPWWIIILGGGYALFKYGGK